MDFVWTEVCQEYGCDLEELETRLSRCGYALNSLHDDERERRIAEGITDERAWSDHCQTAGREWAAGKFHEKCGKPARFVVVTAWGIYAYCVPCLLRDGAVGAKAWMHLRIARTITDEEKALFDQSCMVKGWYDECPWLETFLGAVGAFNRFTKTLGPRA